MNPYLRSTFMLAALALPASAICQERFELRVPGGGESSLAVIAGSSLEITRGNEITVYRRDSRYDDTGYVGFHNAALGQVIRWPTRGQGNMQIGTVSAAGVAFRPSQMTIRKVAGAAAPAGSLDMSFYYRITNDFLGSDRALDADQRGTIAMGLRGDFDSQAWRLVDSGAGLYRLTTAQLGSDFSLTVDPRSDTPSMAATESGAKSQLWRLTPSAAGSFVVTNEALGPRRSLDIFAGGAHRPVMARTGNFAGQQWQLARFKRIPSVFVPTRLLVNRRVVANPPLRPVEIRFANTYDKELWVLLFDLRDPNRSIRLKIPPGGAEIAQLDRDAGGKFVETWERRHANGSVSVEEIVAELPPRSLYDVSVYELIVQSVAIDRTKRGAGRIEDIQRSPKSVGIFPVSPGDSLHAGTTDIYQAAKRQGNPGGVRRLDPQRWQTPESFKK